MTARWLIYGATGHTGRLLARRARAVGLTPVLAGRDAARLEGLAAALDLEYRAARLDDPAALARLLQGASVVLNAAGPFVATAGPLAAACLATGTHYVDVTGEPAVFAALERHDSAARRRGVMLLPGAGFVVAATDCLAAHAARRLPGAARLRLGISRPAVVGRGTLRTIVRHLGPGYHVRRGGRLALLRRRLEHEFDFGSGRRASLAVDWADAVTAFRTTGIPDIATYLELLPWEREAVLLSRRLAGCLRSPLGQALLQAEVAVLPETRAAAARQARCTVVAEAEDRAGRRAVSRLRTPDGSTFTTQAALGVIGKVLAGDLKSGFQTPAGAYGADFVLGLGGVVREDLAG